MATEPRTIPSLFSDAYTASGYDEMWGAGKIRPHWKKLIDGIERSGPEGLERWQQEVRRHLRENGVTYSIQDDPSASHRPWKLDTVPFVIDGEDWSGIEAGLAQRAELLNLVLLDIYGPNKLIRTGLLPPELVHAHAGYLHPCEGIPIHDNRPLRFHSTDLARGPNGKMWVLRDRTQSPYGVGYALENRTVISDTIPHLMRAAEVKRLSGFFRAYLSGIGEAFSGGSPGHRSVFLTPGPFSDQYFEHTYLSAYMGFPLVTGDDLTVREGRIHLKTVEGLQPVNTIVRGVQDRLCDPLELSSGSTQGVPGMVEAIRRSTVGVVNTLGCGVLENLGLNPFLPRIARELLGEELKLDAAATWWCGQPKECAHVLAKLDQLIIAPINRSAGSRVVLGPNLDAAGLETWRARIQAEPHLYVGQEIMTFSTVPSLSSGQLEPRHAVLTTFAAANRGTYNIMPGGLTRTTADRASRIITSRSAVISKDTWVLGTETEPYVSLWLQSESPLSADTNTGLPSKTAENLFWVGRYAERAEGLARLMRLTVRHLLESEEFEDPARDACIEQVVNTLNALTEPVPTKDEKAVAPSLAPEAEIFDIAFNPDRRGSMSATINALSRSAYATRGRWSADSWRVIESLDDYLQKRNNELPVLRNHLNELITGLAAFGGLNLESMTRELGWHILDIGRRVERGLLQIELLSTTLVDNQDRAVTNLLLESVLSASESLMTYRRRYRGVLQLPTVLELLVFDPTNPRSIAHQMGRLEDHFEVLPRKTTHHRLEQHEKLIAEAHTRLRVGNADEMARAGTRTGKRKKLKDLFDNSRRALMETSNAISHAFFSHTETDRHLSATSPYRAEA